MYSDMGLMRFSLGVIVAGLPLYFLQGENVKWARMYIVMLVLGFAITNWQGLGRATRYASKELNRNGE